MGGRVLIMMGGTKMGDLSVDELLAAIENDKIYLKIKIGSNRFTMDNHVPIHVHVVESAIPGVYKPDKGHCIHHVDNNPRNNTPRNLVLCESQEYHLLLHVRTRALKACGNANWRMCSYCKQYDAIEKLSVCYSHKGDKKYLQYRHAKCYSDYEKSRSRKAAKKMAKSLLEGVEI